MRHLLSVLVSYLIASSLGTLIPLSTSAQVVPDGTLPNNTIVAPNGQTIEITGGTEAGDNLFHSFQEFSLLMGETAFFDNGTTIENIISRVTGDSISNIEGLIRANGSTNLFLINPNGIIFGKNAALDIGGSFIGSTADSLKFADGSEFSATAPSAEPLLTVSIPVGLQYGGNAGDITVRGTGNNLSIDPDSFTVDRSDRPEGLAVDTGLTLALVGGNVFLPGSNLTAAEGRVEIGSVAGTGIVSLTPDSSGWSFNYDQVTDFQTIGLFDAASIEVSGNSGGNTNLQGETIAIADGAAILADTLGSGSGGSLTITAAEAIEIVGSSATNFFPTRLSTDVDLGATGNGGDLTLFTNYLSVADGAQLNSGTFDLGDAGNLTVNATEIEVIGESADGEFASGLFAQSDLGETGNGGNLSIATDYLLVADGAQISTTTFGFGDAGDLNVTASEIELIGASSGFESGLFVSTEAEGNGGNLTVATDSLLIADGAEMTSTTFGSGDAGDLHVTASEIELIGGAAGVGSSGLFANVEAEGTGSGGNLSVATTSLLILDGAQISTITFGLGDAGTINISAENINLVGTSPGGLPSGLFATVESSDLTTTSAGGDLSIVTDRLQVNEGAQIATSTSGSGDAGDLQIVATESIRLRGTSDSSNSGLFATALAGDGSGGNLNVTTDSLEISDGATISVSNFPSSDNSPLEPGIGAAGNLSIAARDLDLNRGTISADTFTGDRGNINIQTDLLFLQQNSTISTNAQGSATGGNIFIDASEGFVVAVPQENNDITANAVFGQGGNVNIVAQDIIGIEPQASPTPDSDITASSEFGIMGEVSLKTQDITPSAELVELSKALSPPQLDRDCLASGSDPANNSRFVDTGRGGLIPQSEQTLNSNDVISDVSVPQQWSESNSETSLSDREASATSNPPVEAQTWLVNEQGNIELVTAMPEGQIQLNCELRSSSSRPSDFTLH
ncbi:MAG: S-layer family protein [Cyanobacteria bacterium P01_A01_bin.40]